MSITDLRELQAQIRKWPRQNQPQMVLVEGFIDSIIRELSKSRVAYRRNRASSTLATEEADEERTFMKEGLANAVILILQLGTVMGYDIPETIVSIMETLNEFYAPQMFTSIVPQNPLLNSIEK